MYRRQDPLNRERLMVKCSGVTNVHKQTDRHTVLLQRISVVCIDRVLLVLVRCATAAARDSRQRFENRKEVLQVVWQYPRVDNAAETKTYIASCLYGVSWPGVGRPARSWVVQGRPV